MSYFYSKLKECRQSHGYYQRELAEVAGISLRAYQLYEQGKTEPSIDVLIRFADIFNVSLDYLVGRSDDPQFPLRDSK